MPLESETNRQETATFARTWPGRPNSTEPQRSPPPWGVPFKTAKSLPRNDPDFFPRTVIQASEAEELNSAS